MASDIKLSSFRNKNINGVDVWPFKTSPSVSNEDVNQFVLTAYKYMSSHNYEAVQVLAEESIRQAAYSVEGYKLLGLALFGQQRYWEAVEPFNKALDLLPHSSELIYFRGLALCGAGDLRGAREDFLSAEKQGVQEAGPMWRMLDVIRISESETPAAEPGVDYGVGSASCFYAMFTGDLFGSELLQLWDESDGHFFIDSADGTSHDEQTEQMENDQTWPIEKTAMFSHQNDVEETPKTPKNVTNVTNEGDVISSRHGDVPDNDQRHIADSKTPSETITKKTTVHKYEMTPMDRVSLTRAFYGAGSFVVDNILGIHPVMYSQITLN
ncbi:MAG: hypothetical protein CSYNP_02825 [Syntrophus sp. SKADARSKE-3]|nr:hypothetical protein [Syntrophus sp. SKADARSKE-3]